MIASTNSKVERFCLLVMKKKGIEEEIFLSKSQENVLQSEKIACSVMAMVYMHMIKVHKSCLPSCLPTATTSMSSTDF